MLYLKKATSTSWIILGQNFFSDMYLMAVPNRQVSPQSVVSQAMNSASCSDIDIFAPIITLWASSQYKFGQMGFATVTKRKLLASRRLPSRHPRIKVSERLGCHITTCTGEPNFSRKMNCPSGMFQMITVLSSAPLAR